MQTGKQVLASWQAGASTQTDGQERLDLLTVHQLAVGHGNLQSASLFSRWDGGMPLIAGIQGHPVLMPGH